MNWEDLQPGDIVYATSSCSVSKPHNNHKYKKERKSEIPHFVIIVTEGVFNRITGTKTGFHLGVAISKHRFGEVDIEIESEILTQEIKDHFGNRMEPKSFLTISNPIIIKRNGISSYTKSKIEDFYANFGTEFCNSLCDSEDLLKESLFKNMDKYSLPDLSKYSSMCSCNTCGCINPYEAKLMQGQTTLSMCPDHMNEIKDYILEPEMLKGNIACLNAMQVKYGKMQNGDFGEGESEFTMITLKTDIDECKEIIEMQGGYCYEITI